MSTPPPGIQALPTKRLIKEGYMLTPEGYQAGTRRYDLVIPSLQHRPRMAADDGQRSHGDGQALTQYWPPRDPPERNSARVTLVPVLVLLPTVQFEAYSTPARSIRSCGSISIMPRSHPWPGTEGAGKSRARGDGATVSVLGVVPRNSGLPTTAPGWNEYEWVTLPTNNVLCPENCN